MRRIGFGLALLLALVLPATSAVAAGGSGTTGKSGKSTGSSKQPTNDPQASEDPSADDPNADDPNADDPNADDQSAMDPTDEAQAGDSGEDLSLTEEQPTFWAQRGDDGSWAAFAWDVENDNLPPEMQLNPWDLPSIEPDPADKTPTDESIQAKLNDDEFSPLKQVLADGPIDGVEVPIMVLVPDTVLQDNVHQTAGIPDAATLKAINVADQLTNGISFTYVKRGDAVQLGAAPQFSIPQLQFQDAKLYQGVVQFYFNMGMNPQTYATKARGNAYEGSATVESESISDGYDRAREQALQQAVRRAVGDSIRGSNKPLSETVTGQINYFMVTNEGYQDGAFTCEVKAYITLSKSDSSAQHAPPPLVAPRSSDPIIMDGSGGSNGDNGDQGDNQGE